MKRSKSRNGHPLQLIQRYLMVILLFFGFIACYGISAIPRVEAATTSAWTINGPGYATTLTYFNGNLYAATYGGLYSSDGNTWTVMNGSPQGAIKGLVNYDGTLYAASSFAVYALQNNQWVKVHTFSNYVNVLFVGNNTLYAGTDSGVYEYSNGNWTAVGGSLNQVASLAMVNSTLYAGTSAGSNAVWEYTNGSWVQMSGSPSDVSILTNVDGTLYAAGPSPNAAADTLNRIWTDTNGTWAQMPASPDSIFSLQEVNGTLYAGTGDLVNSALWVYTNGGWTRLTGSPSAVLSILAVNGMIYLGTTLGVESSPLWVASGSNSPLYTLSLLNVNGTVYSATNNGVYELNQGTWIRMPNTPDYVNSLIYDGGIIYAGTVYGVYKYDGTSWTKMDNSPQNATALLDVDGSLFVGTQNGTSDVWRYSSGQWTKVVNSPSHVFALLDANGIVYAGGDGGVFSYDGTSWTLMSNSPSNVTALLVMNGTLYAGTEQGLFTYDGSTWSPVAGSPIDILSLTSANGELYVGTNHYSQDVWTYADGSWTEMVGSSEDVYAILDVGTTIYAGTSTGIQDIIVPPSSPTSVQSSASSQAVTLTWDAVPGATAYYVYQNSNPTPIAKVTTPTYTVTGLTSGTSYTFAVTAADNVGESPSSQLTRIVTVPSAPTNLSSNDTTSTSTTLSWSSMAGAQSYNIYQSTNATPIANVTSATYQVNNLEPGSNYSFSVGAVNSSGESALSSSVTVNTTSIGSIQMTASGTNVVDGGAITVSGVVYDVHNAVVPNRVVELSSPVGCWSNTNATSESVTANVYGAFSATWIAPDVPTEASTTVTARVYGANATPTSISINVAPPPSIDTTTLPSATEGGSYSQTLRASGGFTPLTWSTTSGPLPAGLSLDSSTGEISGMPTATGKSTFTVQAKDSVGQIVKRSLSITVANAPTPPSADNGGSDNGTTPNVPPASELSTIVTSQTLTSTGGTINEMVGNTGIQVTVPEGAFAQDETLNITTEALSQLSMKLKNEPPHTQLVVVIGVNFSGPSPKFPITVTLTSPAISPTSQIFKLSTDGELTPIKASLKAGEAVISFTSDPDFVVVNSDVVKQPTPAKRKPQTVDMSKLKSYQRVVEVGNDQWAVPVLVRHHMTYMAVGNIMEALRTSAGLMSTWNGHQWDLLTNSQLGPQHLRPGHGKQSIQVNGKLVRRMTVIGSKDPETTRRTTYMPIWYVMQVLNHVGLTSKWNGTTWTIIKQSK